MKKMLICVIAALLLTLPVYIGLAHIQPVQEWFMSGQGWIAFKPLFGLFNAADIQGDGRILISMLLFFSFVISMIVVCAARALAIASEIAPC